MKGILKSKKSFKLIRRLALAILLGASLGLFVAGIYLDNSGTDKRDSALATFEETVYYQKELASELDRLNTMLNSNQLTMEGYVEQLNNVVSVDFIEEKLYDSDYKDLISQYSQGKTTRAVGIGLGLSVLPMGVVTYLVNEKLKKIEQYCEPSK